MLLALQLLFTSFCFAEDKHKIVIDLTEADKKLIEDIMDYNFEKQNIKPYDCDTQIACMKLVAEETKLILELLNEQKIKEDDSSKDKDK